MTALAAAERFEEAADVRDRAAALASALRRQHRFDALRRAGRVELEVDGTSGVALDHGRLARAWRLTRAGVTAVPLPLDLDPCAPDSARPSPSPGDPVPAALADELACIGAWLEKESGRIRVVGCDHHLDLRVPTMPTFQVGAPPIASSG